ncbi:MAG TPA: hypothetical protein P5528_02765 [Steroidobacteraceae bacterium]|nr:hypothetical protein [Steroidobacteraceae bacterium]HRX88345.1 hypothetical protein [Steroidobacteraceae bacterium]
MRFAGTLLALCALGGPVGAQSIDFDVDPAWEFYFTSTADEANLYVEPVRHLDVTLMTVMPAFATSALEQFEADLGKRQSDAMPQWVSDIVRSEQGGRAITRVSYSKKAVAIGAIAVPNEPSRELEAVPVIERTVQTYIDLGCGALVLTVWTKSPLHDVEAATDDWLARVRIGDIPTTAPCSVTTFVDDKPAGEKNASGELLQLVFRAH